MAANISTTTILRQNYEKNAHFEIPLIWEFPTLSGETNWLKSFLI